MRCSEAMAGKGRSVRAARAVRAGRAARAMRLLDIVRLGLAVALGALTVTAQAHKSSDSYLQLDARPGTLAVRWDIALRDLDVALDLDADADGKLTWGEIKAAWPRIEAY